jgi:predicted small lipoprotein YifL
VLVRHVTPRLVAAALLTVSLAGCGRDGPPSPVASASASIDPAVQTKLAETRAEMFGSAPPSTAPSDGSGDRLGDSDDPEASSDEPSDTTPTTIGEPPTTTTLPLRERPSMPETAAVIGDSIAKSAQDIVSDSIELQGIEILEYDAMESRRMATWGGADLPSGVAAIDDVIDAGDEPELWIVALGTNDVGAGTDPQTVRDDIDEILELIPDDAHLIWVDAWVRELDQRARAFNLLLRSGLADRPNTLVLDWHELAETEGLVQDDGVHLTERGRLEYARMIGRALRDHFDRSGSDKQF